MHLQKQYLLTGCFSSGINCFNLSFLSRCFHSFPNQMTNKGIHITKNNEMINNKSDIMTNNKTNITNQSTNTDNSGSSYLASLNEDGIEKTNKNKRELISKYLRQRLKEVNELNETKSLDEVVSNELKGSDSNLNHLEAISLKEQIENSKYNYLNTKLASTDDRLNKIGFKQAQEIALTKPWSGSESTSDTVLRMLVDTHKPLKIGVKFKPPNPMLSSINGSALKKPLKLPTFDSEKHIPASKKILNAREKTLDYKLAINNNNKTQNTNTNNNNNKKNINDDINTLQAIHLIPQSFDTIRAMADRKIEEARAKRAFDNIPKGKQLTGDDDIKSPFLDTTEFFLNRIIKRQNIVPPWIERQSKLRNDIKNFRSMIQNNWAQYASRSILKSTTLEQALKMALDFQNAEIARADNDEIPKNTNNSIYRDDTWEKMEYSFLEEAVNQLNSSIRSYNLQAPTPSRWRYINLRSELNNCYIQVGKNLHFIVKNRALNTDTNDSTNILMMKNKNNKNNNKNNIFNSQPIHTGSRLHYTEKTENHYGVWQFIKDLFSGFRG